MSIRGQSVYIANFRLYSENLSLIFRRGRVRERENIGALNNNLPQTGAHGSDSSIDMYAVTKCKVKAYRP